MQISKTAYSQYDFTPEEIAGITTLLSASLLRTYIEDSYAQMRDQLLEGGCISYSPEAVDNPHIAALRLAQLEGALALAQQLLRLGDSNV